VNSRVGDAHPNGGGLVLMSSSRIIITGPTASGKGRLAAELARRLNGEIISLDSMKIFRGMDIGTAKPGPELRREIPFHFIDMVDPWEDFSVGKFLPLALEKVNEIEARGHTVIFQGGTALYLKALIDGFFEGPEADWDFRKSLLREIDEAGLETLYQELLELDDEMARKIHPNDERRIIRALEVIRQTGRKMSEHFNESQMRLQPGSYCLFAIEWDRETLYERIDRRVEAMIEAGLIDEIRSLLSRERKLSRCASKCIGYRQVIERLENEEPLTEIVKLIQRDSRRFAKHQLTWFRRFPITWLPQNSPAALADQIIETLMEPRE